MPLGGMGDDINQVSGDEQVEGPPTDEFGAEMQPPAAVPEIGLSTQQGEAITQIPARRGQRYGEQRRCGKDVGNTDTSSGWCSAEMVLTAAR